jgi:hypothetical protein
VALETRDQYVREHAVVQRDARLDDLPMLITSSRVAGLLGISRSAAYRCPASGDYEYRPPRVPIPSSDSADVRNACGFKTLGRRRGVDLRDVQIAARHVDPRTTMRYDRARKDLDYILAAYIGVPPRRRTLARPGQPASGRTAGGGASAPCTDPDLVRVGDCILDRRNPCGDAPALG